MKKRYLITYAAPNTTRAAVSDLLGVDVNALKSDESISTLAAFSDNDVFHFGHLNISSIALTTNEAATLRQQKGILAVEEEQPISISSVQETANDGPPPPPATGEYWWNISLVKAPGAWNNGYHGAGIKVAVVDSGIAPHPNLAIAGGISCVPGVRSYHDEIGQGTHCAGIIAGKGVHNVFGIAPDVELYAVKVISSRGGNDTTIIAGLNWCVSHQMNVANLSISGAYAPTTAWATAIKNCQSNNVTVVCAVGDTNGSWFPYVGAPANSFVTGDNDSIPIAVGAIDSNSVITSTSSRGGESALWNQVTIVAPGAEIYSTYLRNSYNYMSGTSMACPHVSGLAALIAQRYPDISPHMTKAKIALSAHGLGAPAEKSTYGYGLINCEAPTN